MQYIARRPKQYEVDMTWPNCSEVSNQAPDWWHLQTHTILYAIWEVNMTWPNCTEIQNQASDWWHLQTHNILYAIQEI
jgi:hypothetical protein